MIKKFNQIFENNNDKSIIEDAFVSLMDVYAISPLYLLIKNKIIDVNMEYYDYSIIGHLYAFHSNDEHNKYLYRLLKALLDNGADVNTIDKDGDTVLMTAYFIDKELGNADFNFFKLVLEYNPDLSLTYNGVSGNKVDIFDLLKTENEEKNLSQYIIIKHPDLYKKYLKNKTIKKFKI